MKKLNIGLIGHKFMGKAHTHAYTDVSIFFKPEIDVVKHTICSNEESVKEVAQQWGWQNTTFDWHDVINNPDIDVVDIAAPSIIHAVISIAAANAGKHVFCEKPLALTLSDAKKMVDAADKAGVVNMIGFNYRRVPALTLAKMLIDDGEIGEIFHFRGIYQQSWLADKAFPLAWRLRKKDAGYGSHGDLGAHVIDIARYLVGEFSKVSCTQQTFYKKRPIPEIEDGLVAIAGDKIGTVDVDDTSQMLVKFADRKTAGYIEVTRYGTGHRNQNRIEINGSKGAIVFDMEKMNELEFYTTSDKSYIQGFRRIQVGEADHPYTANWWPAGHIIGYGDTFVNQVYDFISAIRDHKKVKPDFKDGYICQVILDAAQKSAETGGWVEIEY